MAPPKKRIMTGFFLLSLYVTTFQMASGVRILPSVQSNENRQSVVEENHANDQHRRLKISGVHVEVPTHPDDHLVTTLPLLKEGAFPTKHYAGHLPASPDEDKYFFYWLFEPDFSRIPNQDNVPLLIWLNGGPGCSSMDGLFLENGPFRLQAVNGKWTMEVHDDSWHKAPAYVLYIDQPVGTGLSFTTSGKYPKNDEQVNQDFYYFLTQFLTLHSDAFLTHNNKKLNRPFFFSGESHAGHYIPSMMAYILEQNKKQDKAIEIPLTGAAIGNGWTDPVYQYSAAGAAYGYGLIDLAQKAALDENEDQCRVDLRKGRYTSSSCFGLLNAVVGQSEGQSSNYKVSQYDARKRESKHAARSFPPGHKDVEGYLGGHATTPGQPKMSPALTTQVLKAIHATAAADAGQVYLECTDPPFDALSHQDGLGVVPEVVTLLENGVQLLFFNGVWDLICNHVGNEMFLQNLPWKNRDEWTKAERYAWIASVDNGMASGYVKEYENLIFLKVLNSGHMVPLDVPEVAFDMISTFIYGETFDSSKQTIDRSLTQDIFCPVCPAQSECEDTNKTQVEPTGEGKSGMEFVVRHSWLGAILAVALFLFVCMKRRYVSSPAPPVYSAAGDMELKEYHDSPPNGGHFRDDVELDDMNDNSHPRSNGDII